MPFSWDQTIPGQQETYKQKTISLYIDENRRLDGVGGVRQYMKENYNFDKSVSTYRREFPKWGVKKNDYPATLNRSSQLSVDSGYGTGSNRSSTTKSGIDFGSPTNRQSGHSIRRSSLFSRLSSSTRFSISRPSSYQPDACTSPTDTPHGSSTSNCQTPSDYLHESYPSSQQPYSFEHSLATIDEKLSEQLYCPPHAPPSGCLRAGARSDAPDVGLETCYHCGATKLHHLASISRRTDIALFKEVVKSNLDAINIADSEGNLSIHFAAGAGASLEQLRILHQAGAQITRTNHTGQNLAHLLDPTLYGAKMVDILSFGLRHGISLSQRDCSGRTPLHHLFSHNITLAQVFDLMPLIQVQAQAMTLLDRAGDTPLDLLKDTWQKFGSGSNFPLLEAKLVDCNVPLVSRQNCSNGYKAPACIPDVYDIGANRSTDDSNDIFDIIKRSEHEPFHQGSGCRNILHALAAFSFHANHYSSCFMTDYQLLNCLEKRLENRARVGLDVNQYDADGYPPLHAFLSATFDISIDIPYLVPACVELLLSHGADPTLRDRNGNTALHLACSRGRKECAGKIMKHLSESFKERYIHYLSAENDHGQTVVEFAKASMNSETADVNARRDFCIGLVRETLGQPRHSFMPAAYPTAAGFSTAFGLSAMSWSATLPDHSRKNSSESSRSRPGSGQHKPPSWPSRMSLEDTELEKSFFED